MMTGNLSDDPEMVDPDNGDFTLEVGSPAIDAGYDGSDIGAVQRVSIYIVGAAPGDEDTGVAIAAYLGWDNPLTTTSTNVYFGEVTPPVSQVHNGSAVETYDPPGDLDPLTKYYWRVDVIHPDGPFTTGVEYEFTTAQGPVTPPAVNPGDGLNFNVDGKHLRYSSGGIPFVF